LKKSLRESFEICSKCRAGLADRSSFASPSWAGRYILIIDTLGDKSNVPKAVEQLNLKPFVINSVQEVYSPPQPEDNTPSFDTVIVDTLSIAEKLREIEYLRYIPIVLLSPVRPSLFPSRPLNVT
jgi:osomolarity two-component system sensor histidine kinase NIK1